jgi:hypothetical protein
MYVGNARRDAEIHASPVDNQAAHSRERHQLDQAGSEAEIARFRILYIITELLVNNLPEVLWVIHNVQSKDCPQTHTHTHTQNKHKTDRQTLSGIGGGGDS